MPSLTTAFAQGAHADRPAAATSNEGYYYYETDTQTLFQSTGSAWTQIAAAATVAGSVTSIAVAAPSPLSSAGGPVTTSGTITLSWASGQTQNRVLASPNGSSGAVSLRALVAADIPSLPASQLTSGQLALARGGTATDGTGVSANAVFAAPNGSSGSASFRTLVTADIPSLPASQITSGQLALAQGGTATDGTSVTGNEVFASPNGSSGSALFRALVAADIPALAASKITSGQLATARGGTGLDGSAAANGALLIGNGTGYTLATLTAGSGMSITNVSGGVTLDVVGGSGGVGSVTSVDVAVPSPLSSSGGPITSSGTITLAWASGQTANRVLASPDGTTGAVSLRALVAGDIPSLPASQITSGQLAVARGGTGVDSSSTTANAVFAGPASGSAAAPTFRAMTQADVVQPVAAGALLYAAATCT